MSADRWSKCPKCAFTAASLEKQHQVELKERYGKISAEEYEALKLRLEKYRKQAAKGANEETLREDYCFSVPIMLENGFFAMDFYYGCTCEVCGFTAEINRKGHVLQ